MASHLPPHRFKGNSFEEFSIIIRRGSGEHFFNDFKADDRRSINQEYIKLRQRTHFDEYRRHTLRARRFFRDRITYMNTHDLCFTDSPIIHTEEINIVRVKQFLNDFCENNLLWTKLEYTLSDISILREFNDQLLGPEVTPMMKQLIAQLGQAFNRWGMFLAVCANDQGKEGLLTHQPPIYCEPDEHDTFIGYARIII